LGSGHRRFLPLYLHGTGEVAAAADGQASQSDSREASAAGEARWSADDVSDTVLQLEQLIDVLNESLRHAEQRCDSLALESARLHSDKLMLERRLVELRTQFAHEQERSALLQRDSLQATEGIVDTMRALVAGRQLADAERRVHGLLARVAVPPPVVLAVTAIVAGALQLKANAEAELCEATHLRMHAFAREAVTSSTAARTTLKSGPSTDVLETHVHASRSSAASSHRRHLSPPDVCTCHDCLASRSRPASASAARPANDALENETAFWQLGSGLDFTSERIRQRPRSRGDDDGPLLSVLPLSKRIFRSQPHGDSRRNADGLRQRHEGVHNRDVPETTTSSMGWTT
jgi:hypothetical protein